MCLFFRTDLESLKMFTASCMSFWFFGFFSYFFSWVGTDSSLI